jgi:hypothetical protein
MAAGRDVPPKRFKVEGTLLTGPMTALLLDHASGPRLARAVVMEMRILRALRARQLIRFNRPNRPTHSIATSRGREVMAALLARQADALAARDIEDVVTTALL